MTIVSTANTDALRHPAPGSHVCWVVDDDLTYRKLAAMLLRGAPPAGEKPVVFGPEDSPALAELAPLAELAADPRVAFLRGGPFEPDVMLAMFDQQAAIARDEGYQRLRLVADMDWLLPLRPDTESIVALELLLDRHAKRLDLTIVCAYRQASFDMAAICGALAVHPVDAGNDEPPQFRLVAAPGDVWSLSGELDASVATNFGAAIHAAARATTATPDAPCIVDVSSLEFIDVGSMRAIANACRRANAPVRLVGAAPGLHRGWKLAGFGEWAPMVELVG